MFVTEATKLRICSGNEQVVFVTIDLCRKDDVISLTYEVYVNVTYLHCRRGEKSSESNRVGVTVDIDLSI